MAGGGASIARRVGLWSVRERLWRRLRFFRSESWQNALNMTKAGLSQFRFQSHRCEPVAFLQGPTRSCGASLDRVVNQGQSGSHRTLSRSGSPDFVFAFHDGEEIGPKMLARIAKHTGLAPEDL